MAAKVKFKKPLFERKKRGRPYKNPWDRWFKEAEYEPRLMKKGVEFTNATPTFMQMCRSRALKVGAKVSLHQVDDTSFTMHVIKEPS